MADNENANNICISIEQENKSRQYCSFTMKELVMLFEHSLVKDRTLYESIPSNKRVKAFIDFEYIIDKNQDIQNHYTGPLIFLKILYFFLNDKSESINSEENYMQEILKQFLVLEASTTEKISFHFIHAKPSIIYENISTFAKFIKTVIHYVLFLIFKHKCKTFNLSTSDQPNSISKLIEILIPHIISLRKSCVLCKTLIPFISISDITYLIVKNRNDEWGISIDTNVYSNNQQFRLYECVKYGKNNPLMLSPSFPFENQSRHLLSNVLEKSLITLINGDNILKVIWQNENFILDLSYENNSDKSNKLIFTNINLINEHIKYIFCFTSPVTKNTNKNSIKNLEHVQIPDNMQSSSQNVTFVKFVKKLITTDPIHYGFIHSCIRGNYNTNILFFNIAGDYRYCPKIKKHHQRNTVAIMIHIVNNTYCIRCKDVECDNTFLEWKRID